MDVETQFNIEVQGGIPVVQVVGDLDHYNSPRFRSVASQLIEKGYTKMVVDMTAVDFMDSGGMSGIVFALKRLSAAGGRLYLANCNPRIIRKLDISGFTKMPDKIAVCTSVEEALRNARKP